MITIRLNTLCSCLLLALFADGSVAQAQSTLGSRAIEKFALSRDSGVARPAVTPQGVARTVTNCNDDGAGSLRDIVSQAANGDTVDLSQLACGVITLSTGAIQTSVDSIALKGPGRDRLTIDAARHSRVLQHAGAGAISFSDLSIINGAASGAQTYGGCLNLQGAATFTRVRVSGCEAKGLVLAAGGAIAAHTDLALIDSEVAGNTALVTSAGSGQGAVEGGGVFAFGALRLTRTKVTGNLAQGNLGLVGGGGAAAGKLDVHYSEVSGNRAVSATTLDDYSVGGGVIGGTQTVIGNSTIADNQADLGGAAFSAATVSQVLQSTISGNVGNLAIGGFAVNGKLTLLGSTVVFNTGGDLGAGGVTAYPTIFMDSSIVARNSPSDIDGSSVTVTGTHNLVMLASATVTLPLDTIARDPLLEPLRNNGGLTRTHALPASSPALDKGSNGFGFDSDQRGAHFARGAGNGVDIGAFEADFDRVFLDSFE